MVSARVFELTHLQFVSSEQSLVAIVLLRKSCSFET